jgi:MscS family membrane protein
MPSEFNTAVTTALQITDYLFSYTHLARLGTSLIILIAFLLLRKIFANYMMSFLTRVFSNTSLDPNAFFLKAFKSPLMNMMMLIGLYLSFKNYLPLSYEPLLNRLLSSFIVIFTAQGIHRLVKLYGQDTAALGKLLDMNVDQILIPFFSKVLRFLIIALAFVVIASNWGYDVNGFIAGLGLGGLAFALAAKDLLANIFSGIVIITDKPFSIGDWIKTSEIEGTITDINFRSTKIRTFEHALVTVPNANLVNAPIFNYTKREMRRITFNLGVSHQTSTDVLKKCLHQIHQTLVRHPGIDNTTIFVKFDSVSDNALNIFCYFFTSTTVWEEYLNIKQEINFEILNILEQAGVSLATPRTNHYFETPLEVRSSPQQDDSK